MIDELPSRAAMTVAAFMLLATGLSALNLFGGDAARDAAQALARHLSRQLDALAAMDGAITLHGGVGAAGAFDLPRTLAGSGYRIEVRSSDVRVIAGSSIAVSPVRSLIFLFAPDRAAYALSELEGRNETSLIVFPGDGFVAERARIILDGEPAFHTFVHLP